MKTVFADIRLNGIRSKNNISLRLIWLHPSVLVFFRDVWVIEHYSGWFVWALWQWVTVYCKAPVFTQKAGGLMIPLAANPQAALSLHHPSIPTLPPSLHPSLPSFIPATSAASRQRKKINLSIMNYWGVCLQPLKYTGGWSLSLLSLSLSLFSCTFSVRYANYAQQNEFNLLFFFFTFQLFAQFTMLWMYCVGTCISLWAV